MPRYLRKNWAYGTIYNDVTIGASQMTMLTGHTLPATTGSFIIVVWDVTNYTNPIEDPNMEVMIASYSGVVNVYNITRAQESTIAAAHAANSRVAMSITAGLTTADLFVIGTAVVDETAKGVNKMLITDATDPNIIKYTTVPGGGDMLKSVYDSNGDGVIVYPVVLDETVKADGADPAKGYLDAKVQDSVVVDITTHKVKLSGDSAAPGNNKYYGTDGTGAKSFYTLSGYQNMAVFTSSGTFSWAANGSPPKVFVEVVGGGAGGGGTYTGLTYDGTGGGAAGYSCKICTLSADVSVVVGSGGAGGLYYQAGTSGGNSSFGAFCTANGGAFGNYGAYAFPTGGVGGTASGGDINMPGQDGYNAGGSSKWGFGGAATIGVSSTSKNGTGYGAGGGGGKHITGSYNGAGSGSGGIVIVRW